MMATGLPFDWVAKTELQKALAQVKLAVAMLEHWVLEQEVMLSED